MLDQPYWNAFNLILKMGPDKFQKLLRKFGTLKKAWSASFSELKQCRIDPQVIEEVICRRTEINPQKEWQKVKQAGLQIITLPEKNYPSLLKEIYRPPALLYWKGNLKALSNFSIAIVGTRKPTAYGKQVVSEIASGVARAGVTVISGLALGIDGTAHEAVLEQKGKTVAILGSGLDIIYPRLHQRLAEEIIERKGLLLSEFPLGTPPLKQHFPYRNRIISGLSLGTVIIEAGKKSGALITARYALEQNREVFAVPGSIYNKNSQGPNNLIKMGAKVVTQAEDILEALDIKKAVSFQKIEKIAADSKEEEIILKILSQEPIHIDQIVRDGNLSATCVNSTLSLMEMKGKVKNLGSMYYVLSR